MFYLFLDRFKIDIEAFTTNILEIEATHILEMGLAEFWAWDHPSFGNSLVAFTNQSLEISPLKDWKVCHPSSGSRVPPNFWKKIGVSLRAFWYWLERSGLCFTTQRLEMNFGCFIWRRCTDFLMPLMQMIPPKDWMGLKRVWFLAPGQVWWCGDFWVLGRGWRWGYFWRRRVDVGLFDDGVDVGLT